MGIVYREWKAEIENIEEILIEAYKLYFPTNPIHKDTAKKIVYKLFGPEDRIGPSGVF